MGLRRLSKLGRIGLFYSTLLQRGSINLSLHHSSLAPFRCIVRLLMHSFYISLMVFFMGFGSGYAWPPSNTLQARQENIR